MSFSIRRPSVLVTRATRRLLAARLVACGAVLAVAAAAACQGPTEPHVRVPVSATGPRKQEAVVVVQETRSDSATVDTVVALPHERGFWW